MDSDQLVENSVQEEENNDDGGRPKLRRSGRMGKKKAQDAWKGTMRKMKTNKKEIQEEDQNAALEAFEDLLKSAPVCYICAIFI